MNSNRLLQSTYLEIIFEGRNKSYGSYQLRTSYAERMRKAGLFILSFALMFVAYSVWANRAKVLPTMPIAERMDTTAFVQIELDIPKEPIALPDEPAPKTEVNTLKMDVPKIVPNETVKPEDEMTETKKLVDGVVGSENKTGNEIGIGSENGEGKNKGGSGGNSGGEIGGGGKENVIIAFVDQKPEFPGGDKALYAFLSNEMQYPEAAMNAKEQGKVRVKFVVNEDGSISNIEVQKGFGYGSEAEAKRVVSKMPKWKPARNNGIAVKTWFYLPITFVLN